MAQEERDAESLRRRLYAPGASASDLAGYLQATERSERAEQGPEPPPIAAPSGPPRRPFLIGGVLVVAAAVLGGVLLAGGRTGPASAPTTAPPVAVETAGANGSRHVTFVPFGVLDGGEARHATGSAVQEGPRMVRYTVATDDTVSGIADRFDLCAADVLDALPDGFDPARLPAGEMLELSRSESNGC